MRSNYSCAANLNCSPSALAWPESAADSPSTIGLTRANVGSANVVLTALSCLITSRRFMAYRLVGAEPTAIPIAARFATMLQICHPGIVPVVRSMSSVELETGLESLCRTNMSTAA